MTAKEKAKELVDKYINIDYGNVDFYDLDLNYLINVMNYDAREYALIAVDEIIKSEPTFNSSIFQGSFLISDNTEYWEEVKQEIEQL